MEADDFALQHSDVPKPVLLDEELGEFTWPLPPVRPWKTPPPAVGFWARVREFLRDIQDPFDVEL